MTILVQGSPAQSEFGPSWAPKGDRFTMKPVNVFIVGAIFLNLSACGGHSSGATPGQTGEAGAGGTPDSSAGIDDGGSTIGKEASTEPYDAGVCGTGGDDYYVCGGSNGCFVDASATALTLTGCAAGCTSGNPFPEPGSAPGLCVTPATMANKTLGQCSDGQIMFNIYSSGWLGYPFSVGQALADNGATGDVLRYCDWNPWTGDPLPLPTTCPTFSTFAICGGVCGTCNNGDECRGRSPQHPYGLCLPSPPIYCRAQCPAGDMGCVLPCPAGMSCAQYIDSTDGGEAEAEYQQFCIPSSSCAELGQYPGGAECVDAGTD